MTDSMSVFAMLILVFKYHYLVPLRQRYNKGRGIFLNFFFSGHLLRDWKHVVPLEMHF